MRSLLLALLLPSVTSAQTLYNNYSSPKDINPENLQQSFEDLAGKIKTLNNNLLNIQLSTSVLTYIDVTYSTAPKIFVTTITAYNNTSVFFSSGITVSPGFPLKLSGSGGFITSASSVNASAFFGDGSNLTNVNARDFVTVEQFGAVGDCSADDHNAIQSAINSFTAGMGGTVYFANKCYKVGSTINWSTINVHLIGMGNGIGNGETGTELKFTAGVTGFQCFNGNGIISGSPGAWSSIENMEINGTNSTVGTADGIYGACNGLSIRHVTTDNFSRHGVYLFSDSGSNGSNVDTIYSLRTVNNGVDGLHVSGTGDLRGSNSNAGTFVDVDAEGNGRWGIYDCTFLGNTYVGPFTENNGLASGLPSETFPSGGFALGDNGCGYVNIYGLHAEENTFDIYISTNNIGNNNVQFTLGAFANVWDYSTTKNNNIQIGNVSFTHTFGVNPAAPTTQGSVLISNNGLILYNGSTWQFQNPDNSSYAGLFEPLTEGNLTLLVPSTFTVTANEIALSSPTVINGGSNRVFRCSSAGNLRSGVLTTVSADCGSSVDTGLRVQ